MSTITMKELITKIRVTPIGALEKPDQPPHGILVDPDCPHCGGSGYRFSEIYQRWLCCSCKNEIVKIQQNREAHERTIRTLQTIGLTEDDENLCWSMIKPDWSEGIIAVNAIRPALQRGHGLIFISGSYGQGKTLIGKTLVSLAYQKGLMAAYGNFMDVLDNIRQAFDDQEAKTTELIRRIDWWTSRQVLFLDEFDKCNDTPWAQERKFQIIDKCYMRAIREQALTVIASNRGDEELDGYIQSRLNDRRVGPVIHLNGVDGRQVVPAGWKH